jgi:uncharacterized SAM-binding protein YcdF (DUF218 family)
MVLNETEVEADHCRAVCRALWAVCAGPLAARSAASYQNAAVLKVYSARLGRHRTKSAVHRAQRFIVHVVSPRLSTTLAARKIAANKKLPSTTARPHSKAASAASTSSSLCAAVMLVLALVAAGGWLVREPVLVGAANLWAVSDHVTRADAIVVLGGGLETRPFEAAELWRRGLADRILISQGPEERAASVGAIPSHSELNREILLKLGVPAGAMDTFGTASKNTRDEAVALREWAERNAASVFIIPTEIFSARRVRWIFRHEFFGTAVSIQVLSVEPREYTPRDWWKTEKGMIAFQNEFLKYIYYRLTY